MKVKQLDHINLSVKDFDESVDWYRRAFGFDLVEENVRDGVRWGVLRSGEAMLCIYEHPTLNYLDRFELVAEGLHGMAHFALRITDQEEWLAVVDREHLPILYNGAVDWPHSTSWYVNDPTGYEIEVALWDDDRIAFS